VSKQLTKGKLTVLRSRTTGIILLIMMAFLIIGFVFSFNEPTIIQLTDDIQIEICPPFCDEFLDDALGLEVPLPEFEPRTLVMTPIVTTTDDQGKEDVIRGEGSFLQKITGLAITKAGTEATFDNGRLKIDLEIETDLEEEKQISLLGNLIIKQDVDVIIDTITISAVGLTSGKIFISTIYDERIDSFVQDGMQNYEFIINDLTITFDLNEFQLESPTSVYQVTFTKEIISPVPSLVVPISTLTIDTQLVNFTQPEIVQVVEVDIPNVICPDIKTDSVTLLFPSVAVSGTTSLWGKTPEGYDQISMEVRNNRNCDLDIAIGSKWRSTSGTQYNSGLIDMRIPTNNTIPIKTVPFDSTKECGVSCAGLEIQWCFYGQVSTTNPIEIIKELCGKKIYR
jgi:hypothetical protein